MEDARGEHGIRLAVDDALGKVLERADTARSDDRNRDSTCHRARERDIEAILRAIAVHARKQDLAGATPRCLFCPGDGVDACRHASAVQVDLPPVALADLLCVDCDDDGLRAECLCRSRDEAGLAHGSGVDRHLVGTRCNHRAAALDIAEATAHGIRDAEL